MADLISDLRTRCQENPRVLGLPESDDPRVLKAGLELLEENAVSSLYLFHDKKTCAQISRNFSGFFDLDDPRIVWFKLRFNRDVEETVTATLAKKGKTLSPIHVATYLLARGELDTICAGAVHPTAEVIRSALTFLELTAAKTVTSSFLLNKGSESLLFADCAVIIDPSVEQLVDVAAETVATFKLLFPKEQPRVAFLSFSTKGSASHPQQKKMQLATDLFQKKFPEISSDGEMQFDAAIDPAIALHKSPQSRLRGDANCFIFPNLDAGNIGYKICQRMGKFAAFGPILQGFAKPMSDLSRGASSFEIKAAAYINMCRSRTARSSVGSQIHRVR